MQNTLTKNIGGFSLDFSRLLADEDEVQYVVTFAAFTKDEIIMLFKKTDRNEWKFIYRDKLPFFLLGMEGEISDTIKSNKAI